MAECGLVNLGSCIIQKLFEFLLNILNGPSKPFLQLNLNLLAEPVNLDLFFSLWTIIIYLISMFYALLLMYAGFNFIVSGYNSAKREEAKNWLRNVVLMIILVQSSFFLYKLVVDLSATLTSATLTLIDPNFFLLGTGGIADIGLAFTFSFLYLTTLILTAFILLLRYGIVCIGVVLFPLAIFFYFIPALREYGLLILNFLGTCIFITFIDAVLLVGFSELVNIGILSNMKIFVLISAFSLVNLLMFFMMFFSIIKSAINAKVGVATLIAKAVA